MRTILDTVMEKAADEQRLEIARALAAARDKIRELFLEVVQGR
jgi:hypothetical protein